MAPRPCCRSCRHCHPFGGVALCRLRQVALHPELMGDLSCHHWTARAPELPRVPPADSQQLPLAGISSPRG